jgi:EAL domain-containing protein (putative c-di-GMP-specific phosphodiesterase class I)
MLSLNVTGTELAYSDLIHDISAAVQEAGLAPSSLHLEVLESVALKGEQPLRVIEQAKSLGFKISLDDFGSGYSCLSRLRSLPVDAIKIDRSLITHVDSEEGRRAIVRTIVTLAHELGLEVIGEGAETLGEVTSLLAIGCHYAQGYYFSRPVPPEQAVQLLHSNQFAVAHAE